MSDCYCDYDPPKFVSVRTPRARKLHKCHECARTIRVGETYEYVSGMWDGYLDTFKTCSHCRDIRQYLINSIPCYCWAYGGLDETLRETIEDVYCRAGAEVAGLAFRVGRLLVARKRAAVTA